MKCRLKLLGKFRTAVLLAKVQQQLTNSYLFALAAMTSVLSHANSYLRKYEPLYIIFATILSLGTMKMALVLSQDPSEFIVRIGYFKRLILGQILGWSRALPSVKNLITKENEKMVNKLVSSFVIPNDPLVYYNIPHNGLNSDQIVEYMKDFADKETLTWTKGSLSGKIYSGQKEVTQLISKVHDLFSLSNALHPNNFPSIRKFEAETIRMVCNMLNGDEKTCGALTSGGTESILMAMKTYYKFAVDVFKKSRPQVVMCETAHPAFDKAADYFGLKVVRTSMLPNGCANTRLIKAAINSNTIAIVGSAPSYPHGAIDDIEELSRIASEHQILLHVDACLGGFFLPWAKLLGHPIPSFDFCLPGVSSISCDTHKFGYGPKGQSVLVFANKELRRHMYFVQSDWIGGIYASPTSAGSRPGAPIAATWAVMMFMGQQGYIDATKNILATRQAIIEGTSRIPEIQLISTSLSPILAWKSELVDMFKVLDAMAERGWCLDVIQNPNGFHICLTMRHINLADKFVKDLLDSVNDILHNPQGFEHGMASIYGTSVKIPDRSIVQSFVTAYLDSVLDALGPSRSSQ